MIVDMLSAGFTRDVGCRVDLTWRCDLADPGHSEAFVDSALATSFEAVEDASRMGLAVLEEPGSGHRVLVVLRTGRVQVRLDAWTPRSRRVGAARAVFERLQAVVR